METYIIHFMTAYIANIIITSAVHFISFYIATDARADVVFTKFFILPATFKGFISYLLSLDYWSDASFKENNLLRDEKCLANFIKKSNWINSIISTIVFISLITTLYFLKQENLTNLSIHVKLIWVIRTISRSFEIIIAFGKDVMDDGVKNSDLKPGDRIKLAIISNFETTLNYAVVYLFISFVLAKLVVLMLIVKKLYVNWILFLDTFLVALEFQHLQTYLSVHVILYCKIYLLHYI